MFGHLVGTMRTAALVAGACLLTADVSVARPPGGGGSRGGYSGYSRGGYSGYSRGGYSGYSRGGYSGYYGNGYGGYSRGYGGYYGSGRR